MFIRMGAFITINMVSKWYSEKKNANINIIFYQFQLNPSALSVVSKLGIFGNGKNCVI